MAKKDAAGNGDVKTLLSKLKKLSPTPTNIRRLAREYREITDPSVRDAVVDFLFVNYSRMNPRASCLNGAASDTWMSYAPRGSRRASGRAAPARYPRG